MEENMEVSDLAAPIKSVQEKHKMLPHFLRMRGLLRQYTDSFNYFINTEMKQIVAAKSNSTIRSKVDSSWFLEYTDIYVGEPNIQDGQDFGTLLFPPILPLSLAFLTHLILQYSYYSQGDSI